MSFRAFWLRNTCLLALSALFATSLAGQDLRPLAEAKGVYLGNIMSAEFLQNPTDYDGGLHDGVMTSQYNSIVLENDMKMSYVLPSSEPANLLSLSAEQLAAQLNATGINDYIIYSRANNLRTRGHAMIWFNQAPGWLDQVGPSWTAQEVFDFSRNYINALGILCGDGMDEWDVLNEAISDATEGGNRVWRTGTWYDNANDGSSTTYGEASFDNYVKMLFVWARAAQPDSRLYYNDYSIEFYEDDAGSKNNFMRTRFAAIKAAGAPIDGIGFQSHWQLSDVSPNGTINGGLINGIEQSMQWLAAEGLDVAITELDVRICSRRASLEDQRVAYFNLIKSALSQPNCREVLIWGMRDDVSWIETTTVFPRCNSATLYELPGFTKKPAWSGAEEALGTLPNASFPPVFPPLNPGIVDTTGGGGGGGDGGGGGFEQLIADGAYHFKKSAAALYLTTPSSSGDLNTVTATDNGTAFQVTHLSNNEYEITSLAFPNQRLEVRNAGIRKGALVGLTTAGAADHRIWIASAIGNSLQFRPRHAQDLALDFYARKANQVRVGYGSETAADQLFTLLPVNSGQARLAAAAGIPTSEQPIAYPNPSSGIIWLKGLEEGQGTVDVRYVSGQLFAQRPISVAGSTARMDVSELPSGVYLLTIRQEGGAKTIRFVRH